METKIIYINQEKGINKEFRSIKELLEWRDIHGYP